MRQSLLLTVLAALLLGLTSGAASAVDLVGTRQAEFQWSPASGPVAGYSVYVSRNGEPFPSLPEQTVLNGTSTTVAGDYRETITVRIRAFDTDGNEGPVSSVSETVTFVPEASSDPDGLASVIDNRIAVYHPPSGTWFLGDAGAQGAPPEIFRYGFEGTHALLADWDGDGRDSIAVYYSPGGAWFIRNRNGPGDADFLFGYGFTGTVPVAGDWNGDGVDTIGLYDPPVARWYLKNRNAPGDPDRIVGFGASDAEPVVGDWNGDGIDTIGTFEPDTATWHLRRAASDGSDRIFQFGSPGTVPVAGDWDGDGADDIGVYEATTGRWRLRGNATPGSVHHEFVYGFAGTQPVVAD